jgi:membrane protease YdiL (CAAX protease family)
MLGCLAVYGMVWLVGLGGFSPEGISGQSSGGFFGTLLLIVTLGFLLTAFAAFGEELGWRGLLVPELAKVMSFGKLAFISAAIWAVYHYPVLLFADYNSSAPRWYAFALFTLGITGVSFLAAWLRLRSGSLWTGVLLHASHNLFVFRVFDALTVDRGITEFLTTEFGAGLAMVYVGAGVWAWSRRRALVDGPVGSGAPETV